MEMQRKSIGRSAQTRGGGGSHVITVALPLSHDGVGKALRSSFATQRDAVPDDMLQLLAKLDRH